MTGGTPTLTLARTADVAPREKDQPYWMPRTCALDGCETTFRPSPRARHKRYCTERHARIAANRRYRERRTETATCKGCGAEFERSITSEHLQVYCTTVCQYRTRSVEYRQRPDILEQLARDRIVMRSMPAGR